jgi:hypothetical protein
MKGPYRYGAQKKDGWWENDGAQFISPLLPICERFFRFGPDGSIAAVGNRAAAARTTIDVLALDHESLAEDRRRVIEEFVYGPKGYDPISSADARRARNTICGRDRQDRFYEFCVAIRDALNAHLTGLAKLSQRRKAVRRGHKRVK